MSIDREIFRKLLKSFGLLMILIYLGAGILLLIPGIEFNFGSKTSRIILGVALIGYGVFRFWRALKTEKDENPD